MYLKRRITNTWSRVWVPPSHHQRGICCSSESAPGSRRQAVGWKSGYRDQEDTALLLKILRTSI